MLIPTFNEVDNVFEVYERINKVFVEQLENRYNYEILFIDNCSTDGTRDKLRALAKKDSCIKIIMNSRNFGWSRSLFYGLINTTGDCTVYLPADMQEPPELIKKFVCEWENGNKIVIGIKTSSNESKLKYLIRDAYYLLMNRIAEIEHVRQFMGFGLYDREFVDLLRSLDDPMPYFRGIVTDLGYSIKKVEYSQDIRRHGKSHCTLAGMYDFAMIGITAYSKKVTRLATFLGVAIFFLCFIAGVVLLMLKLFNIVDIALSTAALIVGLFAIGGIQLFFLGLISEYIMSINTRILHRPLVIEEERLNFVNVDHSQNNSLR